MCGLVPSQSSVGSYTNGMEWGHIHVHNCSTPRMACVWASHLRFLALQAPELEGAVMGACQYHGVSWVERQGRHHIKMTAREGMT